MAELKVINNSTDIVEYAEIRQRVIDARRQTDSAYWELSEALFEVYQNSFYVNWGYQSWAQYVDNELQVAPRKAAYLVAIQESFGKLSDGVKDWVKELGWSKSKELVGLVTNDNVDDMKELVDGKTLREITEIAKDLKNGGNGKLDETNGDDDDIETIDVEPVVKEQTFTHKFTLFEEQHENVNQALTVAGEMANSDKSGHLLDLICTEFLATNGQVSNLDEYLAKVERITGMTLIAYSKADEGIVFGGDSLDEILGE